MAVAHILRKLRNGSGSVSEVSAESIKLWWKPWEKDSLRFNKNEWSLPSDIWSLEHLNSPYHAKLFQCSMIKTISPEYNIIQLITVITEILIWSAVTPCLSLGVTRAAGWWGCNNVIYSGQDARCDTLMPIQVGSMPMSVQARGWTAQCWMMCSITPAVAGVANLNIVDCHIYNDLHHRLAIEKLQDSWWKECARNKSNPDL